MAVIYEEFVREVSCLASHRILNFIVLWIKTRSDASPLAAETFNFI
jgi:hypothetical protein